VFFKYYDNNPVAKIKLHNWENRPVEDIKLSSFVKQYMDNPKESEGPTRIDPGEEKEVDLFGLFTNKLLEISEGSKVSTLITLTYTFRGKQTTIERIETMRVHGRNAMTWDDDRKAGAFVTAKDAAVLKFAKNTAGISRSKGTRAINANLQVAMAMHQALALYGMQYVVDPTTPYVEFSKESTAIDFLQFPKQSLEFKAGDCDDLSILYCALLESVGIETAFVTIPGHIYMAFSLDMVPEKARRSFLQPDELIFMDNKSWVPVEVTEIEGGFLKAWQAGAKQWRENQSKDQAAFYPVHEAWQVYEPTGFPGESVSITLPADARLLSAFQNELVRFIDREIAPQVTRLEESIRRSNNDPKYINSLGILYARYGLNDRAEEEFNKILAMREFTPALMNLGHLHYLKKDMDQALYFYERAQVRSPDNPKILLAVARVHHELENYGFTRRTYNRLKEIAPNLADQFAYLGLRGEEAARAAETSGSKEIALWEEE
jgi:tetratricopeptide (TPR) repeat protein